MKTQKKKRRHGWLLWLAGLLVACTSAPSEPGNDISILTQSPLVVRQTITPMPSSTPFSVASLTPTPLIAPTDLAPSPVPTTTVSPIEPTSNERSIQHLVLPGESLLGLALDYEVPMAAIQLASGLGDAIDLRAGESLTVPLSTNWQQASPYWMVYKVKPGDTLTGIAVAYDLTIEALREVNGLEEGALLAVDWSLVLPLPGPSALVVREAPTVAPTPLAHLGSVGGSSSVEEPIASATLAPPNPPVVANGWAGEILALINQVRSANGLYPLTYNETLAWAAQQHADDCRQRGWCSHSGSDGSTAALRIAWVGYPASGTAECWVQSNSAAAAVEYWMDEVPPNDPHRRTLLSSYQTEIGIGIAPANWGYFIVADFGRPAGS